MKEIISLLIFQAILGYGATVQAKPPSSKKPYQEKRKHSYSTPYFYLARLYEMNKEPPEKIGYAYLRAAWQADDRPDYGLSKKYRVLSLNFFSIESKANLQNKMCTMLSIELSRRLGRFSIGDGILSTLSKDGLNKTDTYFLDFERCLTNKKDEKNHFFSEAKSCTSK